MKLSFIVPTRNEEKSIETLLQCLSQYSGEKEIIVADGNSTDQTVTLAKKYATKIVVQDTVIPQTIGIGRNEGARVATGEYLVFLDADCYIQHPDTFFSIALKRFENDPSTVAITGKLKVSDSLETFTDKTVFNFVNHYHQFLNNVLHIGSASGEFQMIKRVAFENVGGFNKVLVIGEDFDMFRRLAKVGKTRYDPELVIYHTGRRAHTIGWPKLLSLWIINAISIMILKRSIQKEWKVIR
jgi:glycosyltransferase involved in cell wall biosynthesis